MRKKVILSAAVLWTAIGFSGCGTETSESLMKKVQENIAKAESYHMNLDFNAGIVMEASDMKMNMILGGNLGGDYVAESNKGHMDGSMRFELLGQKQELALEFYMVPENEEMTAYTNVKLLGEESGWIKTTLEEVHMEEWTELLENVQKEQLGEWTSFLTLAEETEEFQGADCYKLTGSITGEMMETMIKSFDQNEDAAWEEAVKELEKTIQQYNLTELSFPMELWIEKKEKLPVKLILDYKDAMNQLLKAVVEEETEMEVSFDTFDFTVTFDSYNQIADIQVPNEIKETAIEEDQFSLD